MASVPRRDYAEILHDLEEFDAYLKKLKIARPYDRLRKMIASIREIERYRIDGKLLSLNSNPRVVELVWSLVEGQEFADIFGGLADCDLAILKVLMERVQSGPPEPSLESDTSNEARNIAFELMLGAKLKHAGAEVTLGMQADLVINHAGSNVYIECKRPRYEHKIGHNVTKARHQLGRRFKSDPKPNSSAGLIAVSISKAVNQGTNWFMVDDEAHIGPGLSRDVSRIHETHRRDYDVENDSRVLGRIYQIFTPTYVRNTGLITASWQTEIFLHTENIDKLFPVSGDYLRRMLRRI